MAQYTTQVRTIVENANSNTSSIDTSVDGMIDIALPKIFDFTYPIFDENYRAILEHKIIRHFYTREIGFETVGLWKLKLNDKLNMIMPYYNQLYSSELLKINPLDDTNLRREYTRNKDETGNVKEDRTNNTNGKSDITANITNNGESSGTDNTTTQLKHADTPQGALSGLDYYSSFDNNTNTGTSSTTAKDTSNQTSSNTITNNDILNRTALNTVKDTETYLETLTGNNRFSETDLLLKFRQTFLNIDMMVINDMNDLFMQLW